MAAPRTLFGCRWATTLSALVIALSAVPCGTVKARARGTANPKEHKVSTGPKALGKVLELLADLMVQIDRDATADGKTFREYTTWYTNISMNTKRVIDETTEQIDSLKAGLEEQEAFRDGAQRDLVEAGNRRAEVDKDMNDAVATRKKDRKEFEKNEATLAAGVDQLERSLVVLGKQLNHGGGGAASLLSVAENLRKTLESGPDFDLSAGQRQTLHAFLRAANAKAHRQDEPADFLQVKEEKQTPGYGEYETQSGGVVETLQSVLDKTQEQLDGVRNKETEAMNSSAVYVNELKEEIKNLKNTMVELNSQLSQSQEQSGQMQSQLIAAGELLKVSQDQLKDIEAENAEKTRNYHDRTSKRSDEMMALTEAKQILSSEVMSNIMQGPLSSSLQEKAAGQLATAASFLQVDRLPPLYSDGYTLARRATDLAAAWTGGDAAPALSLLSLRSQSHLKEADPFEKVKNMIETMLAKLQDQQNEEAKHKEWCEREMGKSVASKKEKKDDIRKLTDRISAMDAELAQIADDIDVVTEDLNEMSNSIKAATDLRVEERNAAESAITQAKDAQRLIKAAIKVLKRVYKDTDKDSDANRDANPNDGERTYGWGPGVIGILEVALQDYADLDREASLQESVSDKEYKEMMDQSEIRQATFSKDLEYKGRSKVKLEGDRMRANTDLKGYEKELEAVETYLKELESSCIAKVDSYEERAARRDSELKALKDALNFLNGEGMA